MLYIATLTAYRLLMIWMCAHTGSVLLATLMHASDTGWLFVLFPATSFEQGLAWQTTLAATLWFLVVFIGTMVRSRARGRVRIATSCREACGLRLQQAPNCRSSSRASSTPSWNAPSWRTASCG